MYKINFVFEFYIDDDRYCTAVLQREIPFIPTRESAFQIPDIYFQLDLYRSVLYYDLEENAFIFKVKRYYRSKEEIDAQIQSFKQVGAEVIYHNEEIEGTINSVNESATSY